MYLVPLVNLLTQQCKNLAGKYAKQVLYRIESHDTLRRLDPDTYKVLRKIILDAFNDMHREYTEVAERTVDAE